MNTPLLNALKNLEDIENSLSQTRCIKSVKAIRDKAEAVRHFAHSAALGLQMQNRAAELKLRAERKAGELLTELTPHGGNRKSSSRDESLRLSDLGINHNQSARWRREAAVSEDIFKRYVIAANELGKEITAQGLLRLERLLNQRRRHVQQIVKKNARPRGAYRSCALDGNRATQAPDEDNVSHGDPLCELICELKNHNNFLSEILQPLCNGNISELKLPERRLTIRLLQDVQTLLIDLEHILFRA